MLDDTAFIMKTKQDFPSNWQIGEHSFRCGYLFSIHAGKHQWHPCTRLPLQMAVFMWYDSLSIEQQSQVIGGCGVVVRRWGSHSCELAWNHCTMRGMDSLRVLLSKRHSCLIDSTVKLSVVWRLRYFVRKTIATVEDSDQGDLFWMPLFLYLMKFFQVDLNQRWSAVTCISFVIWWHWKEINILNWGLSHTLTRMSQCCGWWTWLICLRSPVVSVSIINSFFDCLEFVYNHP